MNLLHEMDDPYIIMEECIQIMADKGHRCNQEFNWETATYGIVFKMPPYPFNYPIRRLTIEELLAKFFDEGKSEYEEMEIFIREFITANELLIKEQSNLLSDLKIKVNELSKVMGNVLVPRNTVNKVTTKGEKMTSEATPSKGDMDLMFPKSKLNDDEPWYADFANYIVGKVVSLNETFQKRKRFFSQVKTSFWEEPYAFKLCVDNIIKRCVARSEIIIILGHCHLGPTGGHHSAKVTARKVYQSRFYWPSVFKDSHEYVR
nr:reverse transcriptase domain-containing protein [Tanacetum cinerariifolium]